MLDSSAPGLVILRSNGREVTAGVIVDPAGYIVTWEQPFRPVNEHTPVEETRLEILDAEGRSRPMEPVGSYRGLLVFRALGPGPFPFVTISSSPVQVGQAVVAFDLSGCHEARVEAINDAGGFQLDSMERGRFVLDPERRFLLGTVTAPPAQMSWLARLVLAMAKGSGRLEWPPAPPNLARTLLRLGDERWREHNDLSGAFHVYAEVLRHDPMNAAAYLRRGDLHRSLKQYEVAAEEFSKAIALDPHSDEALWMRAQALAQTDALDAAVADMDAALRLNTFASRNWFWRGRLRQKQQRWKDAHADYSSALSIEGDHISALAYRGLVNRELDRIEEARADMTRALDLAHTRRLDGLIRQIALQLQNLPRGPRFDADLPPRLNASDLPVAASKIYIDTCSLMEVGFARFLETWVASRLSATNTLVLLSGDVVDELRKHIEGPVAVKREKARRAWDLLRPHLKPDGIRIVAPLVAGARTLADNAHLALLQACCLDCDQTLVTNDFGSARDAREIACRRSVKNTRRLEVLRVGREGEAEPWRFVDRKPAAPRAAPASEAFTPAFRLEKGPADWGTELLVSSSIPVEGASVVAADGVRLALGSRIGGGHESAIYATEAPDTICKIYGPKPPVAALRRKLEIMCSRPLVAPGLCWPRQLVSNTAGEFVGYLMPRCSGKPLHALITQPELLPGLFPEWDRVELVKLTLRVLGLLNLLHRNHVLGGAVSPENIWIQDANTFYFVDTDSYQVERFPCLLGQPPFMHPDLIGRNLAGELREPEHENFAVSTLVFMLMLPGKPPYSKQDGEGVLPNAVRGSFPYKRKDHPGRKAPNGPWGRIWSHLPTFLREQFHQVFTDRISVSAGEWLPTLRQYLLHLQADNCPPESRLLFPAGYKLVPQEVVERKGGLWRTCVHCGSGYGLFPGEVSPHGLCLNCRHRTTEEACTRCGSPVTVTLERQLAHAGKGVRCQTCLDLLRRRRRQASPSSRSGRSIL